MQKNHLTVQDQYTQIYQFKTELDKQEIMVCSKPGIPEWDFITPSVHLLAEHTEIEPGWQVLQIGIGNGAGSVILGRKANPASVYGWDANFVAHQCTRMTLAANAVDNFDLVNRVDLEGNQQERFHAAVMLAPKGRGYGQRCLAMAHQALRPGGIFYLAGSKQTGVQPLISDAEELFGKGVILGYKKGNRIVRFIKDGQNMELPGWALRPGISPNTWQRLEIDIAGRTTFIDTLPGIFSYDRLDEGSSFLLEQKILLDGASVLDLGCGWGAIGLWAARKAAWVDMVDSNHLGVAASSRNITLNGATHARAIASDVTSSVAQETYSHILTNPPFHIGREVEYFTPMAFIQQAARVLIPKGELWLVANKFIPYIKIMQPIFRHTRIAAENTKYHILVGIK